MTAADMMEILKKEYGIMNLEEFDAAVEKFSGINLGIFTMPLEGRTNCEQKEEKKIAV